MIIATHAVLDVPAISCSHCKMAIERAVSRVEGVQNVVVDVGARSVAIDYDADQISLDALEGAIGDEGYEVAGRQVNQG